MAGLFLLMLLQHQILTYNECLPWRHDKDLGSVLINLVSVHPYPSPQSIPLASAFLKAYASKSSVSITLVDFFLGDDFETCAAKLVKPLPIAIGFSIYLWNRDFCFEIASLLRRSNPSVILFCGGPEVTADPIAATEKGIFDFVVTGEGEIPFLNFCQTLASGKKYAETPGILLPGSNISPSHPLRDLDEVPSPYLSGVIDTQTNPGILWQLSRGCSFTCEFCFDARGIHGVRRFSLERLEAELQHFAASGVSQIFVLDSTFNLDSKRAKKILRMIEAIAPDIHFHFEVRNELIDREMAKLFSRITCSLQIGLQSADKEVLKLVGRSFNQSDFINKTGLLNEYGAVFGFDLIYGLPGDTLNGFKRSLDFALSLYPNHLDIFPLAVLPGTRLAEQGATLKICWDKKPPYLLLESGSFTRNDMTEAAGLAAACDIFYSRGKAVAWFNSILSFLGLKPSKFLREFSLWLNEKYGQSVQENEFDDAEILELQQCFLKQLLRQKKADRYLPLVLDLVNYHHKYASALLAPMSKPFLYDECPVEIRKSRYKLAPSTQIARFSYNIEDILACGEPNIRWMFENLSQTGSEAVIYQSSGVVCTESLAASYMSILDQLYAKAHPAREVALTDEETYDFLIFALNEGIIELADE